MPFEKFGLIEYKVLSNSYQIFQSDRRSGGDCMIRVFSEPPKRLLFFKKK
jgi:hypothetical protein